MKQILVRYINIILGAIVAAFALEEFLVPANILDGGIVGTSIIISSITPISLSILTVCLIYRLYWWERSSWKKAFFRGPLWQWVYSLSF